MTDISSGLFNSADLLHLKSLDLRSKRSEMIKSNIANAETPGYRAVGLEFEKALQQMADPAQIQMKATSPKHFLMENMTAKGGVEPEIFIRPNESVGHDGNTVDLDEEMARMQENQILYRGTIELLNRKIGVIRYAISGGR